MHTMQRHGTGLRERKKLATQRAIEEAAVRIASEVGYEATTAEAVAEAAGVSLRTFFNYFHGKEEAIAGRGITLVDDGEALSLLEAEPRLLAGIARVVDASVADLDATPELMHRRRALAEEHPALLLRHLSAIDRFETELTRVVADHLRAHRSRRVYGRKTSVEDQARLAVTVVGAAMRFAVHLWVRSDGPRSMRHQMLLETLEMMAELHRSDS
jgi:AcrR family transcriptional regulator